MNTLFIYLVILIARVCAYYVAIEWYALEATWFYMKHCWQCPVFCHSCHRSILALYMLGNGLVSRRWLISLNVFLSVEGEG